MKDGSVNALAKGTIAQTKKSQTAAAN